MSQLYSMASNHHHHHDDVKDTAIIDLTTSVYTSILGETLGLAVDGLSSVQPSSVPFDLTMVSLKHGNGVEAVLWSIIVIFGILLIFELRAIMRARIV